MCIYIYIHINIIIEKICIQHTVRLRYEEDIEDMLYKYIYMCVFENIIHLYC